MATVDADSAVANSETLQGGKVLLLADEETPTPHEAILCCCS
jgi:hypothetical protein